MKTTPEREELSPEELAMRHAWFDWYMDKLDNQSVFVQPQEGVKHRCPCCGCKTLDERGGYDICPVCFWEDDGQDDADADTIRGGPNGSVSLTQARANFREFGAAKQRSLAHVRKPLPEEL